MIPKLWDSSAAAAGFLLGFFCADGVPAAGYSMPLTSI